MNNIVQRAPRAGQEFDQPMVEGLKNALLNAPSPARKLTKKEALECMSNDLAEAVRRGHTRESIAAILLANGLQVSARTITQALRATGGKKVSRQRKTA